MLSFSKRNGYVDSQIQFETVSENLKNRLFAAFFNKEFYDPDQSFDLSFNNDHSKTGIENMMVEMGLLFDDPVSMPIRKRHADELKKYLFAQNKWYSIFDFIEKYLAISNNNVSQNMTENFNHILEEEASGYRISNLLVVPITNEMELAAINKAQNTPYESVNIHMNKALKLFADRKQPDYENSIKESISAVEAMCCIITGMEGKQATLGNAIKKLKDNGIHIHQAMEKAYLSLYGYTSDENGIRHGTIDFTNAPSEDAKYMLVSCSAFVNYLIEKWNKIKP
jgi:hypothetical protein